MARFRQIHDESFTDSAHIDSTIAFAGQAPLRALWDLLDLPGGRVLEIGPGSGHLLAAARDAGCTVPAVESSAVHRQCITDAWGIAPVYRAMDEIPGGAAFDTIMAINVFGHVHDIAAFLRAVRGPLAPGGTCYLSAPNGNSLEASVLGPWWPMCKVHDHVSFPSPAGLALAARASGLHADRIWSTGLPCEFGVSALAAARDRARARRGSAKPGDGAPGAEVGVAGPGHQASTSGPAGKAALVRFYAIAARLDPSYRVLGALGRAGSIKARLTVAGDC
jgi:SAM-dependent methyltransferase